MNHIFRICPKCIMFIRENNQLTVPKQHYKDTCHACQTENTTTMPMQIKVKLTESTKTEIIYHVTEQRKYITADE